jgi:hypothetical protein
MRLLFIILIVLLSACTQLATQRKIDESQISEIARTKLQEARELIRTNQLRPAITKLAELKDENISPIEKALKYNLKGVILFNMGEIDKSLLNFIVAEEYSPKDTQLYSQVQLNMAGAHFRLNQYNDLKSRLDKIDYKALSDSEKKKHAQLTLAYAKKFENHPLIVRSLVILMGSAQSFSEIQSSNDYEGLKESFKQMSQSEKIVLLEEFDDEENLAVAQLAQIEAEERYIAGDKSGAQDVVSWLRSEFGDNDEVRRYINEFELRIENSSRISINDIGLVLPLTGDNAAFGKKALSGIDTGLKILGLNENIRIHTKDSMDSPAQGAEAVLKLIREDKVAFIIGGLFSDTAKAEYLEARKYGVLYISLSPINLPKEEKNHHLIEVQGSIESQVAALLSEDMIKKFGSRIGVIYPEDEGGKAYVEEIWRKGNEKKLQITSLASFPKKIHDYRETAKLFLGLKYPRERSEEYKILEDVYSLEKTAIRRVQTLPPVIDFDWVFLATFPQEASLLIPTLGYYDANRLKLIGGPSWASRAMVKEQKNLGTLYFVGDDPKDINQEMLNKFEEIYQKRAGLIEIFALDAMKIGAEVLIKSGEVSNRDDFDARVKEAGNLKGLTTSWKFADGIWLKELNAMAITQGKIVKLFETDAQ